VIKNLFTSIFIVIITITFSQAVNAETIDVSREYNKAIGQRIQFTQEDTVQLSVEDALQSFKKNNFISYPHPIISLGLGSKPVWVAFEVINSKKTAINRNLLIESSWIDKIDIYFFNKQKPTKNYKTGDSQPFSERMIDHRFFIFDHGFKPGITTVIIRAETPDPMVLPIYFMSPEKAQKRSLVQGYSYGFVYGVTFALIAYNFMLFIGLKSRLYLYYSTYLSFFLICNFSYTGHGYEWIWSYLPSLQQYLNPILMLAYGISGLLFASCFLNLKTTFPTTYRFVISWCILFSVLSALTILSNNRLFSLQLAFIFVLLFSVIMVILGTITLRAGSKSALFFVLAAITAMLGAAITTLAVWGIIPLSSLTFRAVEIGMMFDAILLALALTNQFQRNQEEKKQAIIMARTDQLTKLNNRRAFYDFVKPIWEIGLRNKRETSLIILDIDKFKSINDTYGHTHGDQVLIMLGDLLKNEARTGDISARWGGEEFIIFLPETTLIDAVNIANRIRKKVSGSIVNVNKNKTSITVSLGVAHHIDINHITLDELIITADRYLYAAKEQGRDQVCSKLLGSTSSTSTDSINSASKIS